MGVKNLAEAIILQSMEDLWDEGEREEAVRFFEGEGFNICAEMAGMNFFEQLRLYNMANRIAKRKRKTDRKSLVLAAA